MRNAFISDLNGIMLKPVYLSVGEMLLTCRLKCLNILGALGEFGNSLDESNSGLLVCFEGSEDGS